MDSRFLKALLCCLLCSALPCSAPSYIHRTLSVRSIKTSIHIIFNFHHLPPSLIQPPPDFRLRPFASSLRPLHHKVSCLTRLSLRCTAHCTARPLNLSRQPLSKATHHYHHHHHHHVSIAPAPHHLPSITTAPCVQLSAIHLASVFSPQSNLTARSPPDRAINSFSDTTSSSPTVRNQRIKNFDKNQSTPSLPSSTVPFSLNK